MDTNKNLNIISVGIALIWQNLGAGQF